MGKTDTPTQALTKIEKELIAIVRSEALGLMSDLVDTSPVDDGHFIASWSFKKNNANQFKNMKFTIRNKADYADVLARGRRFVNGRYEGSLQWQNGLAPMLQTTSKNIERRSNAVRE